MPWERKTVDEKRKEFVARAVMREDSFSALCREYGISRPTGYKWLERYQNGESMLDKPMRRTAGHLRPAVKWNCGSWMCGLPTRHGAHGRSTGL